MVGYCVSVHVDSVVRRPQIASMLARSKKSKECLLTENEKFSYRLCRCEVLSNFFADLEAHSGLDARFLAWKSNFHCPMNDVPFFIKSLSNWQRAFLDGLFLLWF